MAVRLGSICLGAVMVCCVRICLENVNRNHDHDRDCNDSVGVFVGSNREKDRERLGKGDECVTEDRLVQHEHWGDLVEWEKLLEGYRLSVGV